MIEPGVKQERQTRHDIELERYIAQYTKSTGDQAWTTQKVADWLYDTGQWVDQRLDPRKHLAQQLSRAARRAVIMDDQGNRVRKYHAYRFGPHQPMFWSEMERILPDQMQESKAMRRGKLAAGCVQLHLDLNYYNEKHNPGEPILFDPNFKPDIDDFCQPSEYHDEPPATDDGA